MAGVMVLLAIMLIFSTVAFQSWDEVARRDNEAEMIFRAEEIVRAIQRYRKDRGVPPAKLEDLLEPGSRGQYFIRQLYTDPLVKDGKWGLLYVGPGNVIIDPNAPQKHFTEEELDALGVDERARARKRLAAEGERPGTNPPVLQPLTDPTLGSAAGGGRQYAGLLLAGVRTLCDDLPFRVYKGNLRYPEWLFTWVDLEKPKLPGQPGGRGRGRGAGAGRPGGRDASGLGGRPGGRRNSTRGGGRR
jgi:hypothetical protein